MTCSTCRYWSDQLATQSGTGPLQALCLNKQSPHAGRFRAGAHSCDQHHPGAPIDEPGKRRTAGVIGGEPSIAREAAYKVAASIWRQRAEDGDRLRAAVRRWGAALVAAAFLAGWGIGRATAPRPAPLVLESAGPEVWHADVDGESAP